MSVATALEDFTGKQVILTTASPDGGDASQREGKVEAGSSVGLAFKEKGKRDAELVEPDEIIEIVLAPEKPKSLAQKKLKPISESNARQHLTDRHGLLRSEVNKMTDEDAFTQHEDLDHSDLGHRHVAPDEEDDDENEDGTPESE